MCVSVDATKDSSRLEASTLSTCQSSLALLEGQSIESLHRASTSEQDSSTGNSDTCNILSPIIANGSVLECQSEEASSPEMTECLSLTATSNATESQFHARENSENDGKQLLNYQQPLVESVALDEEASKSTCLPQQASPNANDISCNLKESSIAPEPESPQVLEHIIVSVKFATIVSWPCAIRVQLNT